MCVFVLVFSVGMKVEAEERKEEKEKSGCVGVFLEQRKEAGSICSEEEEVEGAKSEEGSWNRSAFLLLLMMMVIVMMVVVAVMKV